MMSKSFTDRFNNLSSEQRSYALQSLVQHLYQAGQYDHLHDLIIEDWMQRYSKHDGHFRGFLSDIQLAWDTTEYNGTLLPELWTIYNNSLERDTFNVCLSSFRWLSEEFFRSLPVQP